MPADPFDLGGSNEPAPDGGISPDTWRNLLAFGSQMAVAANARTPQGFLAYGNGISGPLGAGIQGALAQSLDTAKLRSSLGLHGLQGQNIRSEMEARALQNRVTQADLDYRQRAGAAAGSYAPFGGGASADDDTPGPQSSSGGGYRGATYEDAIDGGEGRGRNPRSSAQGYGGFIDSTWDKFSQANPHFFVGMAPDQVRALRADPQIGPQIGKEAVRWLARENAPVLEREGVKPTGQSLALAHRLDPQSAVAVMKAPAGALMPEVLMKAFLPLGRDAAVAKVTAYLRANPDLVANRDGIAVTAGDVRGKFANVPDPVFVASSSVPGNARDGGRQRSDEPRFASTGPMSLSEVPVPAAEPGARAQPDQMQVAQSASVPQGIPTAPPRIDPELLRQLTRSMAQAQDAISNNRNPSPFNQESQRLRDLAYGPLERWQKAQVELQMAGPIAGAQANAQKQAEATWAAQIEAGKRTGARIGGGDTMRPGDVRLGPGGAPDLQIPMNVPGVDARGAPVTQFVTPAMNAPGQTSVPAGLPPAEKNYQKKRGTELADQETKIEEEASNAKGDNFLIDQMRRESQSWDMGKFAPIEASARSYLQAIGTKFGVQMPELEKKLGDYQAFQKNAGQLVRAAVREVSARAAVQEYQMIQDSMPSATSSARGFHQVVDQMQSVADFKLAKQAALAQWKETHPSPEGFLIDFNSKVTPSAFFLKRLEQTPEGQQELQGMVDNMQKSPTGRAMLGRMMRGYEHADRSGLFGALP